MGCLTCTHGQLRDIADVERDRILRAMAKLGCIACALSFCRASFHGFDHRCERYAEADDKTVQARLKWAGRETQPPEAPLDQQSA